MAQRVGFFHLGYHSSNLYKSTFSMGFFQLWYRCDYYTHINTQNISHCRQTSTSESLCNPMGRKGRLNRGEMGMAIPLFNVLIYPMQIRGYGNTPAARQVQMNPFIILRAGRYGKLWCRGEGGTPVSCLYLPDVRKGWRRQTLLRPQSS